MLQAVIAYTLVALAAAWVLWHIVLPSAVRDRLRPARRRAAGGCGSGGCGDCGGCAPADEQAVTVRPSGRQR